MPNDNLYSRFEARFAASQHKVALRNPGGRPLLSYGELGEAAARMANALLALGMEPGERVSVQIEKSIANVVLYLAVLKCGGVYQPLNTAYTLAELDYFIADASPRIVVCDPSRQQAMRALGDKHNVNAVVNLDADSRGSLSDLAQRMEARHDTVAREADDLAGLLYTSGTTGRSKGAMITHGNLASNAEALLACWAFTPRDVLLHALPIYHVHGLFVALNTGFLNHSEIVWFDKLDAEALIAWFPRATMLMGVPTFYTRLLASPALTREACRNMRVFISGSAPLLAETHREFAARTGHAILERYGMTETGMITSNPYDGARVAGTVGMPLPGVEVRITDRTGVPVAPDGAGNIEVKGPNVFKGYWRMPEKTAQEFRDGFFVTGDIGVMDAEQRVSIVGRAKDVIITGGFNVYPKEVEDEIDALPAVMESAVIGVPHPDFGEGVIAVIVAKNEPLDEKQMIVALAQRLAKFKVPKRIYRVVELPRNAMGKVQKAELRKTYAACFKPA